MEKNECLKDYLLILIFSLLVLQIITAQENTATTPNTATSQNNLENTIKNSKNVFFTDVYDGKEFTFREGGKLELYDKEGNPYILEGIKPSEGAFTSTVTLDKEGNIKKRDY